MSEYDKKIMETARNRAKRNNDFIKRNYDKITATLPKGTTERIRALGMSVNFAVNEALSLYLEAIEEEPEEMPQNTQGQAETEPDKMPDQIGADQEENQSEDHPGDPVELSTWTLPQKSHAEDTETHATAASIMEEFNSLREKMQQEKEEKERAKQEAKEEATRQYIEQLKKIRENGIEPENKIILADF